MALPIKDTPVLKGDDAKKFRDEIDRNNRTSISKKELDKMNSDYQKFRELLSSIKS
jgi:hypothetical protein